MKDFKIILLVTLLIKLLPHTLPGQSVSTPETSIDESRFVQHRQTIYEVCKVFLPERAAGEIIFMDGQTVIEDDEVIHGDLIVVDGDLTIYGKVKGSAIAIDGDIILENESEVRADAISVDGEVWISSNAEIGNDAIETLSHNLKSQTVVNYKGRSSHRNARRYTRRLKHVNRHLDTRDFDKDESFIFRYNRVDGGLLGMGWPQQDRYWSRRILEPFGQLAYGFDSKELRFKAGAQLAVLGAGSHRIGGEYHDFTETQDSWLISTTANSFSSVLFKKDYFDHYRRTGFAFFTRHRLHYGTRLKFEYRNDRYASLQNTTNWALFRGGADFRQNPSIDEGEMRSISMFFDFDNSDDWRPQREGWTVHGFAELAGGIIGGQFDFSRYIVDVRRYNRLNNSEALNFRLRLGSSRGTLPSHFLFALGGISTLPLFDFKEFTGDRMVLLNSEYQTDGRGLFRDFWPLYEFHYIAFMNTGASWFSSDKSTPLYFHDFSLSRLETDIGIAIASRDGDMRLNIGRRLGGGDVKVLFRVERPF